MKEVARHVELFYNSRRLRSTLGHKTPQEVMDEYHTTQTAA